MAARKRAAPARTPEQDAAIAAYLAVLDEDHADHRLRWSFWPQTDAPEAAAARARSTARAAPGGAVETAMAAVRAAFGGHLPTAVDDELCAEIEQRFFALPGGWISAQALHGTGPLADASRRLLNAGKQKRNGR